MEKDLQHTHTANSVTVDNLPVIYYYIKAYWLKTGVSFVRYSEKILKIRAHRILFILLFYHTVKWISNLNLN